MRIIAHRGASGTRPENTLPAFARAVALGADMVELDVQCTRDGEVVVMHDAALDRTTNGRGPVAARTLAEVRSLDAGRWFDPAFAGTTVPTLAEVLAAVPIAVNVELKAGRDDDLEPRTLAVVAAAGAASRVVFSSFDAARLVRLRDLSSDAAIAVLWTRARIAAALRLAERVGARALHIRKEAVSAEGVRDAASSGLETRAWTVNEPADFARLERLGVGAVFTDFPERFLQSRTG
jgi:glycerophosphoryl diester phosphodiesterase